MAQRFAPATPKFPHMLHGGDYNPEQWLDQPEVLEEDIRLFRKAHINCVSLGIFSWAKLEPEEGVFTFDFWDEFMELCKQEEMQVIFGTPTATPPAWLNIINLRLDITHLYYPAKNSFQKSRLKRREIFTELLLYTLTT